jgi:putative ABC transport system permease protein
MDKLDVRRQPRMGFNRVVSLTTTGIRYRLFRSIVTMAVITVAIAFMMNVLMEGMVKRSIYLTVSEGLRESRTALRLAARLGSAGSPLGIVYEVAALDSGDALYAENMRMGQLSEHQMRRLSSMARKAVVYLDFFEQLDYGVKVVLFGNTSGLGIFDHLLSRRHFERFRVEVKNLRSVHLPGGMDEFRRFINHWPAAAGLVRRIREGRKRASDALAEDLGDRRLMEALIDIEGELGERIRRLGFGLTDQVRTTVAAQASGHRDQRFLTETFRDTLFRKRWAARLNVKSSDVKVETCWEMLARPRHARWYAGVLAKNDVGDSIASAKRIRTVAQHVLEDRRFDRALKQTEGIGGGFMGMGQRMSWLVALSMLVCGVGITNAMLMSVAERFREIATMKCLGALDESIMVMFILEASFIGLIGGFLGGILGSVLGFIRMLLPFGGLVVDALPWGIWGITLIVAAVVGALLSALAALYPSWVAARLAPMEAMRIE